MKILTMGSPATTNIFDQKINKVFNGDYDVKKVKSFYSIGHLLSNYKNVRKFAETVKDNEALFDFLKWNFEEGGFWGKLREFKPDILVMDLFTEIYFGSFILPDGTYITRNFRLMDKNSIPEDAILFNTSISVYIPKIVEQVNTFKTRVNEVSPNTKIVINGARFPEHMSKDDVIQENYNAKKFGFSTEKIKSFNWNWELLDYELMKNGFKVLKFDQENSAAELNFPTGKNWYYLYNQNYYTDVQSQIEKFAESYNLGPTTLSIELDAEVDLSKVNQDVVFLHVPNKSNDLKIFRKKGEARNIALKLAAKDYVLHGNKGTEYRFVKRGQLKSVYPKFKNVHYRILPPKDEKKYWSNRLLVRMMSFGVHFKTSMMERNFQADFKTLKDSVVKNTYILEIGDINLINGSFYTNTKNYPNYENEIQELISMIADKYGIDHENVVLYGASRGGVGAVLHGTLGNYKFIAADPVINDTPWYQDNDIHFVNGVRDIDLTEKISRCLENYKRPKSDGIILSSENVGITFSSHLRLPLDKFSLIDLDINLYKHPGFNGKTVPIQLSYINHLLISNSFHAIANSQELYSGVVLEVKHLANKAINLERVEKFRLRISDINKNGDNYERAKENIKGQYTHVSDDKQFKYFEKVE